jgi:tRNA threonylcarbamoyladenosine biosynthesis protein TsaB
MLLLAVDTAGRQGGITLARGDGDAFEVIESASIEGGTFSAELIPQVSDLLGKHQLTAYDLEGLVAVTGPGSFTGIRVGLTAVKGLAEVLKIPIAAVTSLDVLIAAADGSRVFGVLDAGRGEVYGVAPGESELLLTIAEAIPMAKDRGLQVVTPDVNLAASFENSRMVTYRSSEVAARIGLKKLSAGDTVDVLALDANYIRKSEAEYMQKLNRTNPPR